MIKPYWWLALFFMISFALFGANLSWTKIQGHFLGLAVNGWEKISLWTITENSVEQQLNDEKILKIKFNQNAWVKKLVVNPDGFPIIINQKKEIYEYQGKSGWKNYPGIQADEIAISVQGHLFTVGTDQAKRQGLFQWSKNSWKYLTGDVTQVAVDAKGTPWVISKKSRIYKYEQDQWQEWPGTAKKIAIGSSGALWIITQKEYEGGWQIARWKDNQWEFYDKGAVEIAVDAWGRPWIINNQHELYWGR